jgi:hypothetical protein
VAVPCRCLTRTDGVKCTQRKSLPKMPEAYKKQPECPRCGGQSWYVETYRLKVEHSHPAGVCDCGAYRFPHRKFVGRCSKYRFAEYYWNNYFGGGSCEGCNSLNADDPDEPPYCEVVQGQENAKYCAAVQEFEVENNLKGV